MTYTKSPKDTDIIAQKNSREASFLENLLFSKQNIYIKSQKLGQVVQNGSAVYSWHFTVYNGMMIYLGADHGGFGLKEKLKIWLGENKIESEDLGAMSFDPGDDYPDFIIPVAEKVREDPKNLGIIIGRSGNGEAICANKLKGIRAAVCVNEEMAKKARQHNNANIVALGADYLSEDEAKMIVKSFLKTPFSNEERHIRRIDKISQLES